MAERGIHIVRAHLAKLPPSDSLTIAERRAQYERAEKVFPTPPEVKVERVTAPTAPAEWLRPPSAAPGRVVLYLHGGGYVIGSPRSHRHLAAAIATAAGSSALLLEYRCAPEAPFPAAVDDAVAAYRWLLDQGVSAGGIAIAGDSAGGGLTVATLLALRDAGDALPAAATTRHLWHHRSMPTSRACRRCCSWSGPPKCCSTIRPASRRRPAPQASPWSSRSGTR